MQYTETIEQKEDYRLVTVMPADDECREMFPEGFSFTVTNAISFGYRNFTREQLGKAIEIQSEICDRYMIETRMC